MPYPFDNMSTISIIAALGEQNEIGKNNELLWHISDDLKRFKKITTGHPVIMGRNTFLSLPVHPLPKRRNIVITDVPEESFEGCEMAASIEDAMYLVAEDDEAFIMGGGSIYKQFLKHADKLYLTKVHASFDADTFFPQINYDEWDELDRQRNEASETNPYPFTFLTLKRKK